MDLSKAKEIELPFDGPVYDPGTDKYFTNLSKFEDWYNDIAGDPDYSKPKFIHPCREEKFKGPNVDWILESCTEDLFEDAIEHLEEVQELRDFIKAWVAKQSLVTFYPIYSKKIRVSKMFATDSQ